MSRKYMRYKQACSGFGIIMALFIVVTLSTLMAYMLLMISMLSKIDNMVFLSAQTTLVAEAGIEWGLQQMDSDALNCNDTPVSVTLPSAIYPGYTLSVSIPCTENATGAGFSTHTEGVMPSPVTVYNEYTIISTAQHGTFGAQDYVIRQISQRFFVIP